MNRFTVAVVAFALGAFGGGVALSAQQTPVPAGQGHSHEAMGHDAMSHGSMDASDMHHDGMHSGAMGPGMEPGMGGQAAFEAIQGIVADLLADPNTDWSKVDIEALRQHLIDMNNVTLYANVAEADIEGGAIFTATSDDPRVTASIRAMVPAHVATMNGVMGWTMTAAEVPGGATMTVTGADPQKIRALGFIGIMTVGAHHQMHHWALATGQDPHGN